MQPGMRFNVVDGPYGELLRSLRNGEIDILVGALREPVPTTDIVQTPIFGDYLAVVARRGHRLSRSRKVSVSQLRQYPWVVPKQGAPTRALFDRLFASGGNSEGLIEASSLMLIRDLLMGSDRLTLISRQQVSLEVETKMLVYLPFEFEQTPRPIGITMRRDWHPTAFQCDFVELLSKNARKLCGPKP
jgi:LysR family transcriptional regulator of gallate degradation